ncbi:MAG: hypothetical protein QOH58_1009 [Thermoleophilaceae bacterium]|jgi:hypothetical protein|nr:hypothetical protein [Thermoleophilaceae bacterium]
MDRTTKFLRTLAVLGAIGGLATLGTFSAFTSQADNPGNRVSSGTVTLADNDGGVALYDFTNAKPAASQTSCIRVSYTGSLPANVRLYTPDTIGALGPQVNLKIEPGTQAVPSFPACTAFTPDGAAIFDAALSTFPTTYAGGVVDFPAATTSGTTATPWSTA